MVNKHLKRCSNHVIRKMQIKTRYHCTPVRMATAQSPDTTQCWRGRRATGTLSRPVGVQNGAATVEDSLAVSYKTKHYLTMRSSNCAPWYLPKGAGDLRPRENLPIVLTSAVCITARTWKKSLHGWTDQLWDIQTMECYSMIKRNDLYQAMKKYGET